MKGKMATWNAVLIVSMLAMVAIAAYDRLTPMPKFDLSAKQQADQQARVRMNAVKLEDDAAKAKDQLREFAWTEDAETINPQAMASTTVLARRHNVLIAAFRPQKPIDEGTVQRIPYLISVEGTYLDVVSFVKDLEGVGNRLVVNSVQIASSDPGSSQVRGTIGVLALRLVEPKVLNPESKAATNSLGGKAGA